ncbi:MAG: glycolate oxidase subunit GlcF [Pirellulales bacterium]
MFHELDTKQLGPRGEAIGQAVQSCVHCGFCLPACPTYQELAQEMDSPRGRILLMKNVLEGNLAAETAQPHIDRCLGCLACVTACPSGVHYGDLVSSYRDKIREEGKSRRTLTGWLARMTLPYPARFRTAVRTGRVFKAWRNLFPRALRPMLDMIPDQLPAEQKLAAVNPALGTRRGRVALLAGCAQQVLAPDINAATVRVLTRNGIEVIVPPDQGCCGALAWHVGHGPEAQQSAKRLMASIPKDVDALIINAAGCGSAVHEYPLLLAGTELESEAKAFAEKAVDISVYLDRLELAALPKLKRPVRVAYHDACHLAHAQGVRSAPRRLLDRIEGLELVTPADADTCCGSAGTYNIEQPEIARKLGDRKAENILATRASIVATGNIGCLVQLDKHLRTRTDKVTILHTVQVVDRCYREILS